MSFLDLPDDIFEKIARHCCLNDQRNLNLTCKMFSNILRIKLQMYHNEIIHVLDYLHLLYTRTELWLLQMAVRHIIFREKSCCIKITYSTPIKLKYVYRTDTDTLISEKIQASFYFMKYEDFKRFILMRITTCNMYLNVLCFSQKYNYVKIY